MQIKSTIAYSHHCRKYISEIELVCTVPGISTFSAISVIGEIGVDMSVFPTSKQLCSWAGLTPQNDQSAGKKKTTRISRAGAYIKPLLVQCALAAIKAKNKHPEIFNRYSALKKRRDHKKAIIAIARMLLTAIYNILKSVNLTILSFIENLMSLPNIAMFRWMKLFLFFKDKGTWFLLRRSSIFYTVSTTFSGGLFCYAVFLSCSGF